MEKLDEAEQGIAILKEELTKEEVKLGEAAKKTDKLLKEIEVENQKAKKKADEFGEVKQECEDREEKIVIEKADARKNLVHTMPYLEKLLKAVDSNYTKRYKWVKVCNESSWYYKNDSRCSACNSYLISSCQCWIMKDFKTGCQLYQRFIRRLHKTDSW